MNKRCRKVKLTKINAKIVLMRMQSRDKGAKRIYYCDNCKAWHITSQPLRENGNQDSTEGNSPIVD